MVLTLRAEGRSLTLADLPKVLGFVRTPSLARLSLRLRGVDLVLRATVLLLFSESLTFACESLEVDRERRLAKPFR
jgi:hypothetical protein